MNVLRLKLLLIFILIIVIGFQVKVNFRQPRIKLDDDEIALIFVNEAENHYLLLLNDEVSSILILKHTDDHVMQRVLNRFKLERITVLMLEALNIGFPYKQKIIIDHHQLEGDDLKIKKEGETIKIEFEDNLFCIYLGGSNKYLSACNYLYYYQIDNLSFNSFNRGTYALFYRYDLPLPSYFLEEAYERWIDTYMLRDQELLMLKFDEDDVDIIILPNME